MPEAIPTYFEQRMGAIGITAANNYIEALDVSGNPVQRVRFSEDTDGNIIIHYYTPEGFPYQYHAPDRKWSKAYERKRLKVPMLNAEGKEAKYLSPKGAHNCPYFPAAIYRKMLDGTEIATLIVTEGEFKAEAGCRAGLDVVGVSGIHNWYDPNRPKMLHEDILFCIAKCKVRKLIFLTDADSLELKFRPDKELTERPHIFYSALKNFREAALNYIETTPGSLTDVYFSHIKLEHIKNGKGLDDLLQQFAGNQPALCEALRSGSASHWFESFNITDGPNKIKQHFGLASPENFYTTYQAFIEDKEFTFHKLRYRWDAKEEKLVRLKHTDVDQYMRIGCDWFKTVLVPNKFGERQEEIKKWKSGEIQRDYGKRYPTFLDDVPKFDAWCNMPDMSEHYNRIHKGCYNIFNPITHHPAPGQWPVIAEFLCHLFRGAAALSFNEQGKLVETLPLGDPLTVALDYLTLQWRLPTQILPVMCLVSPENGTGKSTFLKFLTDIYGSNATIIDNERFKQKFNSHYITRYVIGIDEGFLDVEKRSEKERLKKLATDERQYLEFKGADVVEIDFYGKIIICSNDADSLMKIEEGEIRWFVVRVPKFEKKEDPEMRNKMRAEIPHFLHYLSTREIIHPKEGRAWFDPKYIETEQLRIIIEKTRNRSERIIEDFIRETFLTYRVTEFLIDERAIADYINKNGLSKYKIDVQEVKNYLQDKRKMVKTSPQRIRIPVGHTDGGEVTFDKTRTARCYQMRVQDWLRDGEDDTENYEGEKTDATTKVNTLNPKKDNDLPF